MRMWSSLAVTLRLLHLEVSCPSTLLIAMVQTESQGLIQECPCDNASSISSHISQCGFLAVDPWYLSMESENLGFLILRP